MGRGSGNTRRSAPSNATVSEEVGQQLNSEERIAQQMDSIADRIAKGGYVSFTNEQAQAWEEMTLDQREYALMQAGFNGLIAADEFEDMGTMYFPADKQQMMSELLEDMRNDAEGFTMDDSTTYTIGYKDGTRKYVSHDDNDFDYIQLNRNNLARTNEEKIRQELKTRDIAYILKTNGYEEPRYYVASRNGLKLLKEYGDFEEWKNGRGEKRRQYVQDDWI